MELGRERLSKFFSEFRNFWGDLQVAADGEKLRRWHDILGQTILTFLGLKWSLMSELYKKEGIRNWLRSKRDFFVIDQGTGLRIMMA